MTDKLVMIHNYEQLRKQALGESFPDGQGLGLAMFIQRGMSAWIQAWSEHTTKTKIETDQNFNAGKLVPKNTLGEITTVLTNMIMDLNRKEAEYGFTYRTESNKRTPAAQSLPLYTPILVKTGTYESGER